VGRRDLEALPARIADLERRYRKIQQRLAIYRADAMLKALATGKSATYVESVVPKLLEADPAYADLRNRERLLGARYHQALHDLAIGLAGRPGPASPGASLLQFQREA